MTPRASICLFVTTLYLGCHDEPAAPTGPGEGGEAPFSDPAIRVPVTPRAKRTVLERNPFGNVAAAQNLLWDGDFEWFSPFTDQYGWFELSPVNPTLSDVVVGPACKSGMKCARLKKNADVIGIAVGSSRHPLLASVWTRFELTAGDEAPSCSLALAVIIDDGAFGDDDDAALSPEGPDQAGWCKHAALVPVRAHKPYLYVTNESQLPMLVDDAVLLADDAAIDPHPALGRPIPEAMRARLERARAAIRATRRSVDGKPNPAREAFERHKRERRQDGAR